MATIRPSAVKTMSGSGSLPAVNYLALLIRTLLRHLKLIILKYTYRLSLKYNFKIIKQVLYSFSNVLLSVTCFDALFNPKDIA